MGLIKKTQLLGLPITTLHSHYQWLGIYTGYTLKVYPIDKEEACERCFRPKNHPKPRQTL